jgi:hypothetical protein
MLDYGCGREARERCQCREISHRMKAPPKGPIVCGLLRRDAPARALSGASRYSGLNYGKARQRDRLSLPGLRGAMAYLSSWGLAAVQPRYAFILRTLRVGRMKRVRLSHPSVFPEQFPHFPAIDSLSR